MKFIVFILLAFTGFTSIAAGIAHDITTLDNGNFKVTTTITFNEDIGLGKLQMNIPSGIDVTLALENKVPSKEVNEGFTFYIYNTADHIELIYEIASTKETEKITFELKYSKEDDRYQQELSGIVLSSSEAVADDSKSEPVLIGTAVGPKTTLASGEVYTVQIIALFNYNPSGFEKFCELKNLNISDLSKWSENGLTKFGMGNYSSKEEGLNELSKLKKVTGMSDLFLTKRQAN